MVVFVGLDIGTSNCCCYVYDAVTKRPEVVLSSMGQHFTPSWVAYTEKDILVGEIAQQQQGSNAHNTFFEFKRVIGHTQKATWASFTHWPFSLTCSSSNDKNDNTPYYNAHHAGQLLHLTALDLYTILIHHMAERLKAHTSEPIAGLVVTVPAHFNHNQRRDTLQAVKRAQLTEHIQVCNEPTAAAVAYAHKHPMDLHQLLMVFDFGAGTLDVTCIQVVGHREYTVLGSQGSSALGGSDLDRRIFTQAAAHYKAHTHSDLRGNISAVVHVRQASEQAKKALSVASETLLQFGIEDIPPLLITRAAFDTWIQPELQACAATVRKVLTLIQKQPTDVHHLMLVGGGSRVPAVRVCVQSILPTSQLHTDINMQECVALGASILAAALHFEKLAGNGIAEINLSHSSSQPSESQPSECSPLSQVSHTTQVSQHSQASQWSLPSSQRSHVSTSSQSFPPSQASQRSPQHSQRSPQPSQPLQPLQHSAKVSNPLQSSKRSQASPQASPQDSQCCRPMARSIASQTSMPPLGPNKTFIHDVLPCSIGIRTSQNIMHCLIPANTLLPKTVTQELYPQHPTQAHADICIYQGDSKCTNQNAYLGFVRLLGLQPGHPQLYLKVTVTTNGMVELDVRDEGDHQVIGSLSL